MDLATGDNVSPSEYRYHYENFIFRAVGVIDRSHRLVGASLMLDAKKYESSRGNLYVSKEVKEAYPAVYAALVSITTTVDSHKALRNAVIHASAFSNREFGLLSAFENLKIPVPDDVDLQGLMREHFSMNGGEVAIVISELEARLSDLLNSLGPIFAKTCPSGVELSKPDNNIAPHHLEH
jgi:hypothetical protein